MCLDGLIAFHDIQDVVFHVFLHHIPRTAAQSKSFALTDGMEPMSLMFTQHLTGIYIDDVAFLFA